MTKTQYITDHPLTLLDPEDEKGLRHEAKEKRQATVAKLEAIARQMYEYETVWGTATFDAEIVARWQAATGETVARYDKLETGRNRFMNLVDWVKANRTRSGTTFNVCIRGLEYRVLVSCVGEVFGSRLCTTEHLENVVGALADLIAKPTG